MKKTSITIDSISKMQLNTRKVWLIKPYDRVVASKKIYNRKDKSWKNEI